MRREDPRRVRHRLRLPAADADDLDPQRALLAHLRPAAPRPSGDRPAAAGDGLPGRLRQLVQPGGGPGRRDPLPRRRRSSTIRAPPMPVDPSAVQHEVQDLPGRDPGVPPGQPVLRHRPSDRGRLAAVRPGTPGLGARPGDLRLRPPPRQPSATSMPARPAPPGRPSTSAAASAATSPTWRSPCAAA